MQPVFFAWKGNYNDLVATGFHAYGQRTRTVALKHGSAYIGVVEAATAQARSGLANLNPNLVVLPGANGLLSQAQVSAILALWPAAPIQVGDSMRAVLAHVHSLYGDAQFDPDAY